MPSLGDTFHLVAGGHLWVVLTKPEGDYLRFVMVNVTTLRSHIVDTTCVLRLGDHPFIDRDSVVFYHDAKEWWTAGARGYDELVAKGITIPNQPMDLNVLRRIQAGALSSDYFKKKYIPRVEACLV